MFIRKYGAENKDDAVFCSTYGVSFDDDVASGAESVAPAEPGQAAAVKTHAPRKKTSLIIGIVAVAAIFASFLLTGCGSPKQEPIVGEWDAVMGSQDGEQTNLVGSGATFEAKADGTFVFALDSDLVQNGTWQTAEYNGDPNPNVLGYYEGTFSDNGVSLVMMVFDNDGDNTLGIAFPLGGSEWTFLYERA